MESIRLFESLSINLDKEDVCSCEDKLMESFSQFEDLNDKLIAVNLFFPYLLNKYGHCPETSKK